MSPTLMWNQAVLTELFGRSATGYKSPLPAVILAKGSATRYQLRLLANILLFSKKHFYNIHGKLT